MSSVRCSAIVVAGGSGERFGRPGGKQLAMLCDVPVFMWSVHLFDGMDEIDEIVVVRPAGLSDEYSEALGGLRERVVLADSGDTRQASVASGLDAVSAVADHVLVHDGARPLVRPEAVRHALAKLMESGADGVVLGHPSVDTLKVVDGDRIVDTPDRSRFWSVQTPQLFRAATLRRAHQAAAATSYVGTDDASLVERLGGVVLVSDGKRDNFKVTVPEDAALAEAVLTARKERI